MMYVYFLNQLRKWNENSKKVGFKVTNYYDSNNNLIAKKLTVQHFSSTMILRIAL